MAGRFLLADALVVVRASPFPLPASKKPGAFSLSYAHRLHHPWQYRKFFGGAEVFRLGECTVFRIPNELGHFRLGITMKARGSSVERNRVKRQIREAMRNLAPKLGSFDYNVVVPGHKKMARPYPERLRRSLDEGLKNALG
jgi:ribonuclease P protein component